MSKNKIIHVQGSEISIITQKEDDYISLTDMAKSQMQDVIIIKWLSLKSTIEYLGEWEALYNPVFNYTEFGTIKNASGSNNFVLSVKQWIEHTNAIGLTAKAGRYGGTYAHKDIAFEFGMWISAEFKIYLIKEFQRLKEDENDRLKLKWNLQRTLAKVNYHSVNKQTDNFLSPFYKREIFEPVNRITQFDHARLFYVAFSRPQKMLVLSTNTEPKDIFDTVWEGLDQWPHVKKETLKAQRFKSKSPYIPKKSLSLTSHINVYETCPRQYQFYKEFEFTPSRTGQVLFGTLVHETIEDLHRRILDGEKVTTKIIADDFENNYKGLLANGHRPLGLKPKEGALRHSINYFQNNQELLDRVLETEIDVSYEKDDYIINGKVDLLLGKDDKLELLDFKSQQKPNANDKVLQKYKYQLHVYAHILKERYNKEPERLYLYWTAEDNRKDALMEIEYDEKLVKQAGKHFDEVATCIINKDFEMKNMPDKTKVCKECDFKHYCRVNA